MLFLVETKNITRESKLYEHILKIIDNLEKIIDVQYAKRMTLTQVLDKIANIDEINMEDTGKLLSVIEEIRNILSRINDNIEGIKKLIEEVNGIKDRLDIIIDEEIEDNLLNKDIDYFYMLYIEKINIIEDTNLIYENIITKAYEYIFLLVSKLNDEKKSKKIIDKLINTEKLENIATKTEEMELKQNDSSKQEIQESKEEQENKENNQEHIDVFKNFEINTNLEENEKVLKQDKKDAEDIKIDKNEGVKEESKIIEEDKEQKENILKENVSGNENKIKCVAESNNRTSKKTGENVKDNNVLMISQIQNKVFLPYKISEVKRKYIENKEQFSSIQDVISTEYVIPLNKYKNPAISRFKEAYNLMREKEDATFSEALDLALEVAFKSNLNPAVITACRDLSELDIYLDCLEENKLDKFNSFKVEYDGLPTLK